MQRHFVYARSARCSSLTAKLRNKLQVMQNNHIQGFLNASPRTRVGSDEFRRVGLLPEPLRVEQQMLLPPVSSMATLLR